MKKLITITLLLLSLSINAQVIKYPGIIFGMESYGLLFFPTEYGKEKGLPEIRSYGFIPELDIRTIKSLYLGASYEYSFGRINDEPLPSLKSLGLHVKHFINPFKNLIFVNRFIFSSEFSYRRGNYYFDNYEKYGVGILNNYRSEFLNFKLGIHFNIIYKLYFNIGYQLKYNTFKDNYKYGYSLGIEYHFGEKREKKLNNSIRYLFTLENKNKENLKPNKSKKKRNFLKFAERFEFNTSFVYIPQKSYTTELIYHEYTLHNELSINLNRSIYLGFQHLYIFTRGSIINPNNPKDNFNIFGVKLLFDIIPAYEDKLYVDTSYNLGNYCTCGDYDPSKKEGLNYFGLGFGYDYPVFKRLALRFAFTNYVILNDIEDKYNFTQYTLGLNVNMGKPYKRNKIKLHDLL
ncbi:MAG TPA: hypothetical protein ENK91_12005 [Bacteroidetes bacterium]|nr:hypothetical protein [Bacteroidota bacterium]